MAEVTQLLSSVEQGDANASAELLEIVYAELRRLAAARLANEKPGNTLQATALVHEAYLRLVDTSRPQAWNGRGHFFGAAAEAMRRILIDRARHKKSLKAGGDLKRHDLQDIDAAVPGVDLLELNDALDALERQDKRQADLVKLRFFAGLTIEQAAEALGISTSTAENDWVYARCWLKVQLGPGKAL